MKKIMSLIIAVTIVVFAAASSTVANGSSVMNAVPTVSVMQDDQKMGKMTQKKTAGKGMKKKTAMKKGMKMKKKHVMKKGMKMKKMTM